MSDARKEAAEAWFKNLRDQICAAFEKIEDVISVEEMEAITQRYKTVAGYDKKTVGA